MTPPVDLRQICHCARHGTGPHWRNLLEGCPPEHDHDTAPAALRSWRVCWPGYTPVDITPRELCPEGLPGAVAEGWAEPYATPGEVPDWPTRQAAALVGFEFDRAGWPLNPTGRTGRTGRNLGKWG